MGRSQSPERDRHHKEHKEKKKKVCPVADCFGLQASTAGQESGLVACRFLSCCACGFKIQELGFAMEASGLPGKLHRFSTYVAGLAQSAGS